VDSGNHSRKAAEVEVIHAANSLADAINRLKESPKFLSWTPSWGKARLGANNIETSALIKDKHFKPEELAELWGVSSETIRSIFREEPGVLKIGKTGSKYKRGYVTLRIPEGVAERVHQRLSA
jgi:predicted transcriptional regulator